MYNDFKIVVPGATGLQNEPIHPSERILGACEKAVEPPTLMPGGHGWATYQPSFDYQVLVNGDANICVPTSVANGGEYASNLLKEKADLYQWFENNGFIDDAGSVKYNNCILAVGSGTNPNAGNTASRVYDYARNNGFSPQSARNYNNSWTKEQFYNPLNQTEKDSSKVWLDKFNFTYYSLPVSVPVWGNTHTPEQLIEGLKKGTPRVSVDGNYERQIDGLIGSQGKSGYFYDWTHSVTLRDFEYGKWWEIHDHYTNQIIKFIWNYAFGNARVGIISEKVLSGFAQIKNTPKIGMYGIDGGKKGKLGIFQNGDDLKFLFGSYTNTKPRITLDEQPADALNIFIQ